MKHLDFMLTKDDGKWLELATNSKKSNAKEPIKLRDDLNGEYKNYDNLILDRGLKPSKSKLESHKDLLVEYYEKPPERLAKAIKSRRTDHNLDECPYCGNPFSPDTLDHFIPKDDWPEFSIYPNNLVPQCRRCAPKKGKRYYCDKEKLAIFIHPIYFNLLSKVGFRVIPTITSDTPEFNVEFIKTGVLTESEILAIKKHLTELQVKSRFKFFCSMKYRHWKTKLKFQKFDIRHALEQRVREKPNEGDFSRDWETAFCKGVLSCQELINHLKQFKPEHCPKASQIHEVIDL